jgi:LAS superfamily LD-carboxypeptidase LdcB
MARAITRAIAAAAADGVDLHITSGWRSRDEQERLYEQAVRKYGSPAAARRWVLPPEESAHVKGEAVDVGPRSGAQWLEDNGVHFGLCRRYDNEWWHFELLAAPVGSVCPPRQPYA